MSRTRPLTAKLRQEEEDKKCYEILARALRRHKADTRIDDGAFAKKLGIGRTTLFRWKNDPSVMSLATAKTLAHECKLTADEWLALGGYKNHQRGRDSQDLTTPSAN